MDDPFGDHHRILARAVAQHHAKTVAAQAADHVGRAQSLIQALGDLDQDPVSGLASEGGVDLVELIDSDRQESARLAVALRVGQGVVQGLAQAQLVEMPG